MGGCFRRMAKTELNALCSDAVEATGERMLRIRTARAPKCYAFRYRSSRFLLKTIINRFLNAKTLSGFDSPHCFIKKEKHTPLGMLLFFWWRRRFTFHYRVICYMDNLGVWGVVSGMARLSINEFECNFICFFICLTAFIFAMYRK